MSLKRPADSGLSDDESAQKRGRSLDGPIQRDEHVALFYWADEEMHYVNTVLFATQSTPQAAAILDKIYTLCNLEDHKGLITFITCLVYLSHGRELDEDTYEAQWWAENARRKLETWSTDDMGHWEMDTAWTERDFFGKGRLMTRYLKHVGHELERVYPLVNSD